MLSSHLYPPCSFIFFNETATTEIYTLSLHDALPIYRRDRPQRFDVGHEDVGGQARAAHEHTHRHAEQGDRKSTRLNSSHLGISYAVFCLKKKTLYMPGDPDDRHVRLELREGRLQQLT